MQVILFNDFWWDFFILQVYSNDVQILTHASYHPALAWPHGASASVRRFDFQNIQSNVCLCWICEQIYRAGGIGAQLHIAWAYCYYYVANQFYSGTKYFCGFSPMTIISNRKYSNVICIREWNGEFVMFFILSVFNWCRSASVLDLWSNNIWFAQLLWFSSLISFHCYSSIKGSLWDHRLTWFSQI
jgi:hypothetical protein